MNKFCTNCGHANNNENQICVECGSQLQQEQVTAPPQKPRKPMTFKAKLMTVVSIIVIASLAGFYSWGTKTASADTAVSKFMEALQEKDAAGLRKYLVLSNGEKLTEKEAEAFIELYPEISPYELDEMATVEKNGKFVGVFDAHKVVLMPQDLSFYFPYEGLELKLNGEEKQASFNDEGEYVFTGLVPGQYKAEFAFDNDEVVFAHPFDLTVYYQEDPTYTATINESMPVGSTVFNVEVAGYAPENKAKVIIGDKEYPVNESGKTEEIGPFLLDSEGSVTAKAEVEFPWGTATSEAVPIDSDYINIDITQLDDEIKEQVLEQYMSFLEEYFEASATRNASVYTFLTPGLVKSEGDEFESWESRDYYFRGSLTKANFDGESLGFWSEGISVDAEVVFEGENYYNSDKTGLETQKIHNRVEFAYDKETEEWLVKDYDVSYMYYRSFTLEPISSIEGSQKLYEYKGAAAEEKDSSEESADSAEEEEVVEAEDKEELQSDEVVVEDPTPVIEEFMNSYNTQSSRATQQGDFSMVSHLITQDGPKRKESIDYIASVSSKGISTEHLGTSVDKVETIDATQVKVTTTERFIVHGTEKSSEKTYRTVNILVKNGDSWLLDELVSTKEI